MTTDSGYRDQGPGNVADPYRDLLSRLDERRRRGLVHRLAAGYYDGWRPTRDEIADLIARKPVRSAKPNTPPDDAHPPDRWNSDKAARSTRPPRRPAIAVLPPTGTGTR